MKFIYEYRTSDNARHNGVIAASSRDAAFAALKAKGIKPSKLTVAPGVFNKILGLSRWWFVVLGLGVLILFSFAKISRLNSQMLSEYSPMNRHQIYGDPALMSRMEQDDYAVIFPSVGDRVLARFAQPGIYVARPAGKVWKSMVHSIDLLRSEPVCKPLATDSREVSELKRIVMWMRGELSGYLCNGVGTADTYLTRLYERQNREYSIFCQAINDLKGEKDLGKFDRVNESLRKLGIKTVPLPEM